MLDCWPFDFLRTQCCMHGSLRSNGQSPPSDCSLQITPPDLLQGVYIGFCLSLPLSLFFSTLFPLYMYMRVFFVMFCVSNMLCASFIKYYCDVLSSSFVKKKKEVFIWMLYCFEVYVRGLSLFMLILIIFCCVLYFVLFCFSLDIVFCTSSFCCFVFCDFPRVLPVIPFEFHHHLRSVFSESEWQTKLPKKQRNELTEKWCKSCWLNAFSRAYLAKTSTNY